MFKWKHLYFTTRADFRRSGHILNSRSDRSAGAVTFWMVAPTDPQERSHFERSLLRICRSSFSNPQEWSDPNIDRYSIYWFNKGVVHTCLGSTNALAKEETTMVENIRKLLFCLLQCIIYTKHSQEQAVIISITRDYDVLTSETRLYIIDHLFVWM